MKNFNELNLSEPILRAITDLGYETPSAIQAEALPLLLGNKTDFLGLAATGTGKTAAFAIPLLERIDPKKKQVQALILCPTRELAIQVAGQIDLLGKHLGVKALPIYGGAGYGDQIYGLKNGATIVVGTPGRVVDHMEKGTLKLEGLETLILDEADEMISMGFKDDLEFVLSRVPKGQANIWLFSATMGAEVRRVADAYLTDPQKVQVNRTEMLPDTVEQIYYMVHEYDKPELLTKLIDVAEDFYGIIFCQTKSLVADLNQFLIARGYKSDCLHGDLDQTGRDRVMRAFRDKKISILIATDVACRGLDVKDISHVINYSLPRELDNYVHRIGRTGRSGKSGIAFSLVTNSHKGLVYRIEQMTKSKMTEGRVPTLKDIALKKVAKAEKTFAEIGPQGRMTELLGESWKATLEPLSKEDIVSRFITLMNPELAIGAAPKRIADSRANAEPRREPRRDARPEGRPYAERRDAKPAYPRREAPVGARPIPLASPGPRAREADAEESAPAPRESAPAAKPERRYQGKRNFNPRKPSFKPDDKRTPPWERGEKRAAPKPYGKKSTPWGSKEGGPARPATLWEKKKFSARDASEGKRFAPSKPRTFGGPKKNWESRPTKPNR